MTVDAPRLTLHLALSPLPEDELPRCVAVVLVDDRCTPVEGLSALPRGMERHRLPSVLVRAYVEAVRYGDSRVVELMSRGRWDDALNAAGWDAATRTLRFDDD